VARHTNLHRGALLLGCALLLAPAVTPAAPAHPVPLVRSPTLPPIALGARLSRRGKVALLRKLIDAFESGLHKDACRDAVHLIREAPGNPEARFWLARCAETIGDLEVAADFYDSAALSAHRVGRDDIARRALAEFGAMLEQPRVDPAAAGTRLTQVFSDREMKKILAALAIDDTGAGGGGEAPRRDERLDKEFRDDFAALQEKLKDRRSSEGGLAGRLGEQRPPADGERWDLGARSPAQERSFGLVPYGGAPRFDLVLPPRLMRSRLELGIFGLSLGFDSNVLRDDSQPRADMVVAAGPVLALNVATGDLGGVELSIAAGGSIEGRKQFEIPAPDLESTASRDRGANNWSLGGSLTAVAPFSANVGFVGRAYTLLTSRQVEARDLGLIEVPKTASLQLQHFQIGGMAGIAPGALVHGGFVGKLLGTFREPDPCEDDSGGTMMVGFIPVSTGGCSNQFVLDLDEPSRLQLEEPYIGLTAMFVEAAVARPVPNVSELAGEAWPEANQDGALSMFVVGQLPLRLRLPSLGQLEVFAGGGYNRVYRPDADGWPRPVGPDEDGLAAWLAMSFSTAPWDFGRRSVHLAGRLRVRRSVAPAPPSLLADQGQVLPRLDFATGEFDVGGPVDPLASPSIAQIGAPELVAEAALRHEVSFGVGLRVSTILEANLDVQLAFLNHRDDTAFALWQAGAAIDPERLDTHVRARVQAWFFPAVFAAIGLSYEASGVADSTAEGTTGVNHSVVLTARMGPRFSDADEQDL
jgi:hypothetical protein